MSVDGRVRPRLCSGTRAQCEVGARARFPRDDYLLCCPEIPVGMAEAVPGGARSVEYLPYPDGGAGRIWTILVAPKPRTRSPLRLSISSARRRIICFTGRRRACAR